MGLLDGGLLSGDGIAADLGKPTSSDEAAPSYRKPLGVSAFDTFGATGLTQGEERELARIRTPAGLRRRWGFGTAKNDSTLGYAYGKLKNGSGEIIHGVLSLQWRAQTERNSQVVEEIDSQDINTPNRYDREQQRPIPEQTDKNKASQDQYLRITFTPVTDPANITNNYEVVAAESELRIPTTEYDLTQA